MSVEIVERGGRLIVSAPYNTDWLTWARAHGQWDAGSRAWTFDSELREEVEAAVEAAFDGSEES